jgi:hypothetical protein
VGPIGFIGHAASIEIKAPMARHHTISLRTPSLSLLLAACVALLSALGRTWGWGVVKGNRICSWEATQPVPLHDLHSLEHKSFADFSLPSALEKELLHNTLLLWFALGASAYHSGVTPTTTAWGARTETFSDDLKFAVAKI